MFHKKVKLNTETASAFDKRCLSLKKYWAKKSKN